MTGRDGAAARLVELFAKVDAMFARTAATFPAPAGVTCGAGCSECCKRRLTVTRIEADAIVAGVTALPARERAVVTSTLASRAPDDEACAALVNGQCAIYAVRPIVCRTHGLPIRFRPEPDDAHHLPVLDACSLNFQGHDLARLPATAVLDQVTLSTVLGALDAAHADELGVARGARFDLAETLRRLG